MSKFLKVIFISLLAVVLFGGSYVALAGLSFKSEIAKFTGESLADKIFSEIDLSDYGYGEGEGFGAIGISYDVTNVDSEQRFSTSTVYNAKDGKSYVYLRGVTGNVAGAWLSLNDEGQSALLTTNSIGRVGVSMSAFDSSTEWGWVQVYGQNTISANSDAISTNAQLYTDDSPGYITDTDASGEMVIGAWSRSAADASSTILEVELNHPFVINAAID